MVYRPSETRTNSETKVIAWSISPTVDAPPHSSYKAILLVNLGKNNDWYKRVEPVTDTMTGSLACSTAADVDATLL